jgi:hypothetical protein
LDTSNTSYGQKKGQDSNWQFNSRPLKVKNHPYFFAGKCLATDRWKALNKGYNFALNFISIGGLHAKLWASKVVKIVVVGNFVGVSKQNDIWVLVPWPTTEYTIKGKVVAPPKSRPW